MLRLLLCRWNPAVEAQALLQLGGTVGRGREVDMDVGRAGQLAVGDAHEVLAADALDCGDVTLDGGDVLLDAVDDLLDGVGLATVVENEGGAVVAFG